MKKIFFILVIFFTIPLFSLEEKSLNLSIINNGNEIIFKLNNSIASKELYDQLPLKTSVENYSNNEKIFYPPQKLSTLDTPLAKGGSGTLAYYAPWGDVVIFYDDFKSTTGLYELGKIIVGEEYIKNMSGIIKIKRN